MQEPVPLLHLYINTCPIKINLDIYEIATSTYVSSEVYNKNEYIQKLTVYMFHPKV